MSNIVDNGHLHDEQSKHIAARRMHVPREVRMAWADALQLAIDEAEPVFVPCQHYCDDRGWSIMNLLRGVMTRNGQINYSHQYPGVVKAWHRHDTQTDFWCCITGHIKAGIHREADDMTWSIVFGEKRPGVLLIPPPLWHGAATVGAQPAGLLYYVTHAFKSERPDEHRRAWSSIRGFDWEAQSR